jgi:two-component sensor histidine kinase
MIPEKAVGVAPHSIRFRMTVLLSILIAPIVLDVVLMEWLHVNGWRFPQVFLILGPMVLWLAAIALVWFAADRQIGGPVRRLTMMAQSYSRGDLVPVATSSGPAELRALAAAFTEMAARIAGREQELREAIATRDAMLREIHHRVKNNLQIVTSLLNLQARSVHGDDAQRAFGDIQTRVRTLALVHRYLYESDDLQSVNLGAFLRELAASLQLSHAISQDQVAIEVEAEAVWDVSDRAVPLALFMTEAMTNALKHAFPEGRRGVIRILLKTLPGGSTVRFSVEDNGVGLAEPQPAGEGSQTNLGMSLIKAFARQVDGKLTISGPPGTIVMIEFTNKSPAPASFTS